MFMKSFLKVIERGRIFKQCWFQAVIFNFIDFFKLLVSKAEKTSLDCPDKGRIIAKQCQIYHLSRESLRMIQIASSK